MEFTEKDLNNLSLLARIDIKDEEKEKMLTDMQAILGYVSEINEAVGDSKKTKEDHYNVTSPDEITNETGKNTEVLMNEAPNTEDGYVKVAQVLK